MEKARADFAGLLASLAAARPTELPPWRDEELPPDVATLSYEQALRAHSRYRFTDDFAGNTSVQIEERARVPEAESQSSPDRGMAKAFERERLPSELAVHFSSGERDRKCASVTIRMSKAECDQLRDRASEAGMTISAYLRSCTFEAESLRAQVKDALAELRRAQADHKAKTPETAARQAPAVRRFSVISLLLSWLRRMVPEIHPSRNPVRA